MQRENTADGYPSSQDGYQLLARIGHGAFATVHKASITAGPRAGREEVAVKVIELEEFADSSLDEIRRELQIMRMCRHENVIAYHVAFPAKRQVWLVMPLLAGGSCANVMRACQNQGRRKFGGFEDECVISYILRETAKAVKYFHDNKQIHRDLKAGNILLSEGAKVFLSDFGVAAPLSREDKRRTFVGTPCWMAPEVLEQAAAYDQKADIWSFGITAIELAYGEAPYQRLHPLKVMKIILEKDPPRMNQRDWDQPFIDLIDHCLQKDPRSRPSMDEVIARHDRFFAKANDQPLIDMLRHLPPLEQRTAPRPAWRDSPAQSDNSGCDPRGESLAPSSGGWDFRLGDEDDGLGALPEAET